MIRFPHIKPGNPLANLLTTAHTPTGYALQGVARVGRRTKNLVRRLRPGEIAVIDHADLDGPAAEALANCRVAAVINAAASITGRYPNRGPQVLLDAGIPVLDCAGTAIMDNIPDGELISIHNDAIYFQEDQIARGQWMTQERLAAELLAARDNLDIALRDFVRNTLSYVEEERGLLFEHVQLPPFAIDLQDRPVVIVVRGEGTRQDLAAIHTYIRDQRPVLIGVDGGADILRELGYTPDIIFGDMDSISDASLQCGAQVIVHAYPDGRCPGKECLDRLQVPYDILPGRGTSEDVIMLAVYEKGAELLIAVGTHFNLIDFLDKTRGGMSSTFLVRLRVGSRLVDAKGVNRLYHVSYPLLHFSLMVAVALLAIGTIFMLSPGVRSLVQLLLMQIQRTIGW
jgi:uncharacterized membrane-anchored protein